jgi:hypothetical protein
MELRLAPLNLPSLPKQVVQIFVNGALLGALELEGGWHTYQLDLPPSSLRLGVNSIGFRYGYTASPAQAIPGSTDTRRLAVAFDYLTVQSE